jgi:uncharacterized membrane-anchored protein
LPEESDAVDVVRIPSTYETFVPHILLVQPANGESMKLIHTPRVNARYWTAIALASVFGTNLGDFYAHESGLGIVKGLSVLALIAAFAFVIERFDEHRHELYYWAVILIIRTGATNIADYLAYGARIPRLLLTVSLAGLIALFGWASYRTMRSSITSFTLNGTNASYWLAMLSAGVFGTVLGDICEDRFGEGISAIALTAILGIVLVMGFRRATQFIAVYWTVVAVARTAGTAIGDWIAENQILHIGLSVSTLLSAIAFVGVLLFWRDRNNPKEMPRLA